MVDELWVIGASVTVKTSLARHESASSRLEAMSPTGAFAFGFGERCSEGRRCLDKVRRFKNKNEQDVKGVVGGGIFAMEKAS